MHPNIADCPIDRDHIPAGIVVSDLIYNPLQTLLLQTAHAKGCITHNGFGMFIYQGAYAFEYWTGVSAPIDAMKKAVNSSFK
ncbi:Shikimate dehydrogenase [compost metagenome]